MKFIKMKKLVLASMAVLSLSAFAQQEEAIGTRVGELPSTLTQNKSMVVQDTLTQPVFGATCDPSLYTYSSGGRAIAGTFTLSSGPTISDVAQLLNLNGRSVQVEALLFFVSRKIEGPAKGSFKAEIYDTIGGPSVLRPDYTPEATSALISYDNIDTTFPGINRFAFATPYATQAPFWASINVDNGSDTLAVYTTSDDCGGAQPTSLMNVNDTAWFYYASVFSSGGGTNPLDFAVWVWAEVDTSVANIGLEPSFISKSGLNMYPNPVNDIATVEFELPGEQNITLVVQDMSGREVYRIEKSLNNGENSLEIDLSGLHAGPHTYQVVGEKKQLNGVFVKK
jgi:GTPase SAR1 family protein